MASLLTDDDALAVARILYGIRQRRAARLAAEQAEARDPQRSKASAAREGNGTDG